MASSSSADAIARMGWDNTAARKGANELVSIAEQTKKRSEAALGSIGSGVKFATAFAGLDGAAVVARKAIAGVQRGLDFNQTLSDSTVGISNVLRRFDGLNKVAAKNEAGRALERIIELEPITAGGLQDLVGGFMGTLAASKGVGLSTMQNIELVAKFANAIANAGLPLDQIRQEFRSILTGTITKDSQIAKILGITNEDINSIRGDGDAIFAFLNAKLGEFGEAGDSATVTFSSLNSAIDKALGATTQQLFELAVRAAKQLAEQLQDQAWVDQMKDAGVDVANVAESFSQLVSVVIEWLPTAIRLGANLAELGPSMLAIGAAISLMKFGGMIKQKLEFAAAAKASTAALQQETAALQQNAAAQQANSTAAGTRDKRSPYVTAGPNKWESTIDIGAAVRDARMSGAKASMGFMEGFKTSFRSFPQSAGGVMLASMNGMVPLMLSGLSSAFIDRSKGIAGGIGKAIGGEAGSKMGPAMMDGLTVVLSSMGPYGALAGASIQIIDGAAAVGYKAGQALAKSYDEAINKDNADSRKRNGGEDIRQLLDKGKTADAERLLQQRLELAQGSLTRARREGKSTGDLELEVGILEDMQKNWLAVVERSAATQAQIRKEQEASEAEQEAAAKRKQEEDEKRIKAWQQIHSLTKDIQDSKISLLPDDQKLAAFEAQLRRIMEDASLGAGQSGQIGSIADLERLAAAQRASGDATGAANTLARLKEAVAVQEKLSGLTENMRNKAAQESQDAAESAKEVRFKREILDLEIQINKAIVESGDEESLRVTQLQDQLSIKQRAKELQQSLNISEAEALSIATQKVTAERAISDAIKQRQRQSAVGEMGEELQIMRELAAGHQAKAQQMQRELDIRREAKRIMDETGLSEQKALEIAREKAALQDAINKRQRNSRYDEEGRRHTDGRKRINAHISGDDGRIGGGGSGLNGFYDNQKTRLRDTFDTPLLDAYDEMQKTPLRNTFETPGLDAYEQLQKQKPGATDQLKDKAQQNAAEPQGAADPNASVGQIVAQALPQIVALLSGS
ncbi:hypothetical protein GCM10023213_20060 [Prosthecobacter algae]|uniref:Tape measure domain-containing protein n=1 Tax=Prosthecobacter algae TaxID=1144682 RepID=A0ABP9P5I6_9BACT